MDERVDELASLQTSQALYAAITASALDCVIVIDEAGNVVEFNPAAERTFGHRRTAVMGRPIGDIIVPPHLRDRHAAGFARYIATGEAKVLGRRMEIEGMRADGEVFPLELAITEVRLPGRRLFTAYLRDLTDMKDAVAALQRSRDALHQSEKMAAFGSLLAGVAHELNNPLSIAIGNAQLLEEDAAATAPSLAARAGRIRAAAERCGRIVRTFLSMARQRPAVLRPVAVGPVVAEVLELLAYGLRTGGIAVRRDIPDELPAVLGDPDQLNQVIANLLVNAQQAVMTRHAPRRITVSARAGAGTVVIEVSDNGPGVPAAISGRVFDPFFTTKPTGSGTGIGLAVSRGVVEAHGGTLSLHQAPGGGARFRITLPAAGPGREGGVGPQPAADGEFAGATLLVVDDEAEVAEVIREMAAGLGIGCTVAANGEAALATIGTARFDAVLCDLHMPGMDGAAVFAALQSSWPALCSRTAFVTADTLGQSARLFLSRSGRLVLEKPFGREELRAVLHRLLQPD